MQRPDGEFQHPRQAADRDDFGDPDGGTIDPAWQAEHARLLAENDRLRKALRGLIACHGMAVNPGTQHAKCGYLASAHAALAGSQGGSDAGS